jgi:predicted permease
MALPLVILGIVLAVLGGAWIEVRHAERAERLADRLLMGSLYVLAPPVIFFNLVHLEFSVDSSLGLALAWVAVLSTGGIAYLLTRNRLPRPVAGAVIVSVLSANTGYLGYPLTTIVLGRAHLPEAVSYDALVTIPILVTAAFGVGAAFGEDAGEGARERARSFIVRNPLLPVFALAMVAPDWMAPPLAVEISQIMVFALLPVGFFAVGVHLAATSPGRLSLPPLSRPVLLAIGLRLAVVPAILFALATPLLHIPPTYLFMAAMPCGLNTLLVANAFGLDRRVAAGTIAWSTALVLLGSAAAIALGGL